MTRSPETGLPRPDARKLHAIAHLHQDLAFVGAAIGANAMKALASEAAVTLDAREAIEGAVAWRPLARGERSARFSRFSADGLSR